MSVPHNNPIPPFEPTHEAEYIITASHRCPVLVDARSEARHPRSGKIRIRSQYEERGGVQWIDSRNLANWRVIRHAR